MLGAVPKGSERFEELKNHRIYTQSKHNLNKESRRIMKNHKEPAQKNHNEETCPVSQSTEQKDLVDAPMFVLRSRGASEELAKRIMSRTLCDLGRRQERVNI